jgi:hypothetical protein
MMALSEDATVLLRHRILDLKDEVLALVPEVTSVDSEAGRSMVRARAALFEAWTILVGPPDEDEDH